MKHLQLALHLWLVHGLQWRDQYMKFGPITAWKMAGEILAFRSYWLRVESMSVSAQIAERLTKRIANKYFSASAKEDIKGMILAEITPLEAEVSPGLFDGLSENRDAQREQVLQALKKSRSQGCTTAELNKICFRFGGRIFELRKMGYKIGTTKLGVSNFLYVLSPEFW